MPTLWGNGIGPGVMSHSVWHQEPVQYVKDEKHGSYYPIGIESPQCNNPEVGGIYARSVGLFCEDECMTYLSIHKAKVELFTRIIRAVAALSANGAINMENLRALVLELLTAPPAFSDRFLQTFSRLTEKSGG